MSNTDQMDLDESSGYRHNYNLTTQTLDSHTAQVILELPQEERDELYNIRNIILEKLIYNYGKLIEDPKVNQQGGVDQFISNVISDLLGNITPHSLTDMGLDISQPVVRKDLAIMREIIEYLTHSVYMFRSNTPEQQQGKNAVYFTLVSLAEQYDDTSNHDSDSDTTFHPSDMEVAQRQMVETMMTTPRKGVKRGRNTPTIPASDISDLTDGSVIPQKRRAKEKKDIERTQSTQPFLGGRRTCRRRHKRTRNQSNKMKKRHSIKRKRTRTRTTTTRRR